MARKKENRKHVIPVRFSDDEFETLSKLADQEYAYMSSFLRRMVFKGVSSEGLRVHDGKCICPQECDCANPPPDDWSGKEGVYHVSNSCPIHNVIPDPDPDCPIHG